MCSHLQGRACSLVGPLGESFGEFSMFTSAASSDCVEDDELISRPIDLCLS